jgi:hypothetical protein
VLRVELASERGVVYGRLLKSVDLNSLWPCGDRYGGLKAFFKS